MNKHDDILYPGAQMALRPEDRERWLHPRDNGEIAKNTLPIPESNFQNNNATFTHFSANEVCVLPPYISQYGVTPQMAKELNFHFEKKCIDLWYQYKSHQIRNAQCQPHIVCQEANREFFLGDDFKLERCYAEFIKKVKLIKKRKGFKTLYYIRDLNFVCHRQVSEVQLEEAWLSFLREYIGNEVIQIPDARLEESFKTMLSKVEFIENSLLQLVGDAEIMFRDGIYKILENEFIKNSGDFTCFSLYSVPDNFDSNTEPVVFEALLKDVFGEDEEKIFLFYQIMGAMISNVKTLKKIFLFQGVSGGGKTRLSNIISHIVGDDYVQTFYDIASITAPNLLEKAAYSKIIYFQELPDKALSSKQVSALKALANGSSNAPNFKIIINANFSVKTESDGAIDRGLEQRILTLPFAKEMDNTDPRVAHFEELYLEKEKGGIIRKALEAFSKYLNEASFCSEFKLNAIIEKKIKIDFQDNSNKNNLSEKNEVPNLSEFLEITEEMNPKATSEWLDKIINEKCPGFGANSAATAKRAKQLLPGLINQKVGGKICYNVRLKTEL